METKTFSGLGSIGDREIQIRPFKNGSLALWANKPSEARFFCIELTPAKARAIGNALKAAADEVTPRVLGINESIAAANTVLAFNPDGTMHVIKDRTGKFS